MDRDQGLSPESKSAAELEGVHLRRSQSLRDHRKGNLFSQRRRFADAGEEGPASTRSAIFQAGWEIARRRLVSCRGAPMQPSYARRDGCRSKTAMSAIRPACLQYLR